MTVCPRNEHSSGTTLGTSQYTKIGGCRIHNSIQQKWCSYLRWWDYKNHCDKPPHLGIQTLRAHWNVEARPQPSNIATNHRSPSSTTWNNQRYFWSPQCLWYIPLVQCIRGIPNWSNFHRRHPQQKLLNMAKANGDPNQPLLPRLRWNDRGTPQGPTPRHTIDQTTSIR